MCQANHTTSHKLITGLTAINLPTAYFKRPTKAIRALIYYPLLLTIGLIIWCIYGLLIITDHILKNNIMPPSEVRVFLNYPRMFLIKPYINFIKTGINFDKLTGFEINNKGCPTCGSNNIYGLETLNECDDCGTYF